MKKKKKKKKKRKNDEELSGPAASSKGKKEAAAMWGWRVAGFGKKEGEKNKEKKTKGTFLVSLLLE